MSPRQGNTLSEQHPPDAPTFTKDQEELLEAVGALFPDGFLFVAANPPLTRSGGNPVNENLLWAFVSKALSMRLMQVHMDLKQQIEGEGVDPGIVVPDGMPQLPPELRRRRRGR